MKFKKPKNVTRLEEAIDYIANDRGREEEYAYISWDEHMKVILKAAKTHLRRITRSARYNRKTIRGRRKTINE